MSVLTITPKQFVRHIKNPLNIGRANSSLFGPLKIDFLHFVTPKQKNYVDSLTQTYREASQL